MLRWIVPLGVVLLGGCAGVGLVASSDPAVKLGQAYMLMDQGRMPMAEDMIGQAMALFKERGDELGMAETYHAYGNLYKNDLYHGKTRKAFERMGTYDGTYMKSVRNFRQAAELFERQGSEAGVVKSLVGEGNAFALRGEPAEACRLYAQALARYRAAKARGVPHLDAGLRNPNYPDAAALIEAFMDEDHCGPG